LSAKALSRHIWGGALNHAFTVRDHYQNDWSLLSTVKEVAEVVELLVDLGWLRAAEDNHVNDTDRRPTVSHRINPGLTTGN